MYGEPGGMTRQTEDLHCKVTLEQLGVKRGTSTPSQCDGIHLPVSGAVGSLSLRLHRQRLWFCTLHETHFAFRFVTKKKKKKRQRNVLYVINSVIHSIVAEALIFHT